jgi:F-box interacting protein
MSSKRQHLVTTTWKRDEKLTVMCSPFDSLNLHSTFDSKSIQLDYSPIISTDDDGLVASCDGLLCFAIDERRVDIYNPCIRKVIKLPYLPRVKGSNSRSTHYAFGYDPFIDDYKVVAVCCHYSKYHETQFKVHSYTLGTDYWKRIKDFPSMFSFHAFSPPNRSQHGIFLRGTVNWLTFSESTYSDAIVSLHLGKESYRKISLPDLPDRRDYENPKIMALYVMRDCLCVYEISQETCCDSCIDVWLMKEYGNKESWIKLIHLPFFGDYVYLTDIVYISEENHVLLVFNRLEQNFKWAVYDSKNDTITTKISSKTQDNLGYSLVKSKVYIESLISP